MTRPDLVGRATLVGARLSDVHLLETDDGVEIATPAEFRGFMVARHPERGRMYGPHTFRQFIDQARANDWVVFIAGRSIVWVYNGALDVPRLAQQLVTVLVDSQDQRIPSPDRASAPRRLGRRFRRWIAAAFQTPTQAQPQAAVTATRPADRPVIAPAAAPRAEAVTTNPDVVAAGEER